MFMEKAVIGSFSTQNTKMMTKQVSTGMGRSSYVIPMPYIEKTQPP
jgi:hypothetical protein